MYEYCFISIHKVGLGEKIDSYGYFVTSLPYYDYPVLSLSLCFSLRDPILLFIASLRTARLLVLFVKLPI